MKGPVQMLMEERLTAALAPQRMTVINDSDRHHGHAGHDGSGESHFTIHIVAEAFRAMSRVDRQRAVTRALGDLAHSVHAIAIKASAPEQ